jgi:uncharacterized protein
LTRPRFLLTTNLARLAKWLRFLGYDAVLRGELSFDALVALAARQRRFLLTRSIRQAADPRKFRRRRLNSEYHLEQIQELADLLRFEEGSLFTRCGECNRRLRPVGIDAVRDRVPEHVAATRTEYLRCPHCRRIYWQGNHWQEIRELLKKALGVS